MPSDLSAGRLELATEPARRYFKDQIRKSGSKISEKVELKRIVTEACNTLEPHALMYVTQTEMVAVLCFMSENADGEKTKAAAGTRGIQCGPKVTTKKTRQKKNEKIRERNDRRFPGRMFAAPKRDDDDEDYVEAEEWGQGIITKARSGTDDMADSDEVDYSSDHDIPRHQPLYNSDSGGLGDLFSAPKRSPLRGKRMPVGTSVYGYPRSHPDLDDAQVLDIRGTDGTEDAMYLVGPPDNRDIDERSWVSYLDMLHAAKNGGFPDL
jgi:hypothetical protein